MLNIFSHPVEWCWANIYQQCLTLLNSHVEHDWPPCWIISSQYSSTLFNIVEFNMLNAFGRPVELCWVNIISQHCPTLVNSTCFKTHLATLLNNVRCRTMNGVERGLLTMKHLFLSKLVQHFHLTLFKQWRGIRPPPSPPQAWLTKKVTLVFLTNRSKQ